MALIFVERSEKLSAKTACDVNVGPSWKKAGNSRQCFRVGLAQLGGFRVGLAQIMVFCAATNFTNRSKSKVRTFKFPADPKIPEEWLKNLKGESFQPTKHSRLCENHFTEESFDESYVIILSLGLKPGKPQLKKNAISTISNVANVGRDKKRRGTGQNESELSAFAKRRKLEVRQ